MGQRRKQSITSYIFTVLAVQSDGSRNICPNLVSLLRVTLYATSYAVWQGSVILNGGSQRVSPKCHRQQWSEAIILTNPNKKLFHKDVNVLDTSKRRERECGIFPISPLQDNLTYLSTQKTQHLSSEEKDHLRTGSMGTNYLPVLEN